MILREELEEFFKRCKKQVSIDRLISLFHIDKEHVEQLTNVLFELEKEGKLFFDDNKKYMHVPDDFCYFHGVVKLSKSNQFYIKVSGKIITLRNAKNVREGDTVFVVKDDSLATHPKQVCGRIVRVVKKERCSDSSYYVVKGVLRNDGNHFYITLNEKRVYISKEQLHTAFAGDLVSVRINNNLGSVVDVLNRRLSQHVFCCRFIDGGLKLVPFGASYGLYELPNDKISEGDMVVCEFVDGSLVFVDKLESSSSIHSKIEALIVDHGFPQKFSSQVLSEAASVFGGVTDEDLSSRTDLRHLETFTIDPVDAKDLDDAVSLECLDGIYRLYVHTANPSHYIHMGSHVFEEAFNRAFSIYPVGSVIPMLPEEYCNGVCSLNEDGDKFAFTCRMDFDLNGNMVDFDIFKSIIHSNKQMDYDTVNDILEKNIISDDYKPFYATLLKMMKLSYLLEDKKVSRGAIDFEAEETKFVFDQFGNPVDVKEQHRGVAQAMIENFMLMANQTIAEYAYHLDLPYIYRNHECPTVQKKDNLRNNLIQKGYFIQKIGNIDNPKIFQSFLSGLLKGKNKEERKVICDVVLKSMSRAYYDGKNIGHYGLALLCYGTFTSPARKISDLINHMIIEDFKDYGYDEERMEKYRSFVNEYCGYISSKQEDVDMLEKEIDHMLLDFYSDSFIGKVVNARISFINQYGIYVKDEHGLTGVIPLGKNMNRRRSSVWYEGHEYYTGEQISVVLKEKKDDELVFEIQLSKDKKLAKKKD